MGFVSLFGTACQTMNTESLLGRSSVMPATETQVKPPPGFIAFCIRHPNQCVVNRQSPRMVHLDEQLWKTLNTVNHTVNRTVRSQDDLQHYERHEYWEIAADGYGDCEDYVITKRKELIDAGLPAPALRITIARTLDNIGHAVLTIITDQGDYILDNRTSKIQPWTKAPYRWISQQSASRAMVWVSLSAGSSTIEEERTRRYTLASFAQAQSTSEH